MQTRRLLAADPPWINAIHTQLLPRRVRLIVILHRHKSDGTLSGRFQRFWEMADGVLVMRNVVNISSDQMNLDVIKFNPLTRELVVQAYILK